MVLVQNYLVIHMFINCDTLQNPVLVWTYIILLYKAVCVCVRVHVHVH